jgi:hypothetical protein
MSKTVKTTKDSAVAVNTQGGEMTDALYDDNLRIPPLFNPEVMSWIEEVIKGYQGLTRGIEWFHKKIAELVEVGKLDPAEKDGLQAHYTEFRAAIDAGAAAIEAWKPGANANEITPQVHRIADHVKHVYAVGSRDISALQYRLEKLAYAGKIDIEAHNDLQHDVCYDMGEGVYCCTIQNLHDEELGDKAEDWGDDHYADSRLIMIKAHITGWEALCDSVPRNDAIEVYGDGVISAFPPGTICQIAPVESRRYWHNTIEIDLTDLYQQAPWVSFQKTVTEEQK